MSWQGADVSIQLPLEINKELVQPPLLPSYIRTRYTSAGLWGSRRVRDHGARAEPPRLCPTRLCPRGCWVSVRGWRCNKRVEGNEETGLPALWRKHENTAEFTHNFKISCSKYPRLNRRGEPSLTPAASSLLLTQHFPIPPSIQGAKAVLVGKAGTDGDCKK